MALIDPGDIKITPTWHPSQYDHAIRNQHLNVGTMRNIKVEHIPTNTIIWLGHGISRSQHRQRQIAMDAMEFILTHPLADKLP